MRNKSNAARIKTAGALHDYHDMSKVDLKRQLLRWVNEEEDKKRKLTQPSGEIMSSTATAVVGGKDMHKKVFWKVF